MNFEVLKKCVLLFKKCDNELFLYLHNFAQVLLQLKICEFITYANEERVKYSFFTNGLLVEGKPFHTLFYKKLSECGLENIDFSAYYLMLEEFERIVDGNFKIIIFFDSNKDKLGNWAGQIEHIQNLACEDKDAICIFEKKNAFIILGHGRIHLVAWMLKDVGKKYGLIIYFQEKSTR